MAPPLVFSNRVRAKPSKSDRRLPAGPSSFGEQLRLKEFFQAEALGDTESHRDHGHDRKQGVKGQRRGARFTLVLVESANRQQQDS